MSNYPTKLQFTDSNLKKLPGPDPDSKSKASEYSDTRTPGLKVQVNKIGVTTFYKRLTVNGEKFSRKIGVYPEMSLAEARDDVTRSRGLIDRGLNPFEATKAETVVPTFEDFYMGAYLEFAKTDKKTWYDDESKLRIRLLNALGDKPLDKITTQEIQVLFHSLVPGMTPASANRHLALLSKVFKTAVSWNLIASNPCTGIKQFRENNKRDGYLSAEQIQKLIAAMDFEDNEVAVAAIKFLLLTGLRRSEALNLRWADVDTVNNTVKLQTTKSGKPRHVVLNQGALDILKSLKRLGNSPFVFPGKDPSKPYVNLDKTYRRLKEAAGIKGFTIHDLRHTFASHLVSNGESIFVVQQLLGHADPKTTQRYAHLSAESLRQSSQVMANIMSSAAPVN